MMGFLIPPVGGEPKLSNFLDRCFLGCLPHLLGTLPGVGLRVGLPLVDWMSLPITATGLSILGFLGVCFILTILF